ncbi:MAG: hypothetical protein H6936_12865 [Burkholderiales bacterium]|nr:hypothetical protein [Burkholderiales bacterium]
MNDKKMIVMHHSYFETHTKIFISGNIPLYSVTQAVILALMVKLVKIYFFSTITLFFFITNVGFASDVVIKINHGSLENAELNQEQLRRIFFSRQTHWPDGTPVRAFVLPDKHPLHIRFSKEILGVYPYQLRSVWDRMMYSGTGVPPITVKNVEEKRSKFEQTLGAIGYFEE